MKKSLVALITAGIILLSQGCMKKPAHEVTQKTTDSYAIVDKDNLWQKNTKPVTLEVASTVQWGETADLPLWGEDEISRMIQNITGVRLDVKYPGSANMLLNRSMADTLFDRGEFPDLIVVESEYDVEKLTASGEVWALDELASEYCPEFLDNFDAIELVNNQAANGHIYAIRTGYRTSEYYADETTGVDVPREMVMRRSVLDALGASVPESVEELEELLYRVKDQGESLGIDAPLRMVNPFGTPVIDWMGLTQENVWSQEEKKIVTPYRNDAWLEYFKMMNRWYTDGVLKVPDYTFADPSLEGLDAGSQKVMAQQNFLTNTVNSCFATAYDYEWTAGYVYRSGTEPHKEPFPYVLVEDALSYHGEQLTVASDHSLGDGGGVMIGKSGHYPDRALLYLQFLMSEEGSKLTTWGVEGTHYTLSDQEEVEVAEAYKDGNGMAAKIAGVGYWSYVSNSRIRGRLDYSPQWYYTNADRLAHREMRQNAERNYKELAEKNRDPVISFAKLPAEHGLQTQYQQIKDLWSDTADKMITAQNEAEVELLWREMQQEIQKLGIYDIEAALTGLYQDALARYQAAGFFVE